MCEGPGDGAAYGRDSRFCSQQHVGKEMAVMSLCHIDLELHPCGLEGDSEPATGLVGTETANVEISHILSMHQV